VAVTQFLQGIRGKVVKRSGNFMPGMGSSSGKEKPLAVPVHVFQGKVKTMKKPDPKHKAAVAVVKADRQGYYEVGLPPGEYTVVAEIDGELYLNSREGDGNWTTVSVLPARWTEWDIEETSDAAM